MSHGYPAGTLLGVRISFPADWPADPMPVDESAPESDWPATEYVPRHAAGVEAASVSPALVQCWDATHPAGTHSERDDCDAPFPAERKPRQNGDQATCLYCHGVLYYGDGTWFEKGIENWLYPALCPASSDAAHYPA